MKRNIMTINLRNNAKTRLVWSLWPWSQYFYCLPWEWNIFPENNFIVTFEEKLGSEIVKRMVVKVARREWDKFYVSELSSEPCVQNDTLIPKVSSRNILNFSAWAYISMYITAEMYKFIESNLNWWWAKLVWWNTFEWEQKINWFFRIWNWLSFWQGWHNILWFWIAENTSENSWVVNSEKIPFEMRHTSEAMIFNIENNLKAIWEYYELWNKNSFVIMKGGNIGIWIQYPSEKLDVDWNIQMKSNSWFYTKINGERRQFFYISWDFEYYLWTPSVNKLTFEAINYCFYNIPTSPAWLWSWCIYRDWDVVKIVP